jgi:hypothetical protein
VGDQRLGLRQLQRKLLAQKLTEATSDLLSFRSWSDEPEQDVIGVADVTQPPIIRIVRIQTRKAPDVLELAGSSRWSLSFGWAAC